MTFVLRAESSQRSLSYVGGYPVEALLARRWRSGSLEGDSDPVKIHHQ